LGSVGMVRGRWRAKLKGRPTAKEKAERVTKRQDPKRWAVGAAAMLTRQRFAWVRWWVK
jgi:hypothetical protein